MVMKLIKYYLFKESIKEMELNKILDKVYKKKFLTSREKKFLDLYQITREDDIKDFLYLSKNAIFKKIAELLERDKKVICNLNDRNGKIGLEIKSLENNFEDETCTIFMKGEKFKLHDKFLYNLIYNLKKDEYYLEEQDEYFEKIPTKNDD